MADRLVLHQDPAVSSNLMVDLQTFSSPKSSVKTTKNCIRYGIPELNLICNYMLHLRWLYGFLTYSKLRYYLKVYPIMRNLKLKAQHMRGSSVFETLVTTNAYQMRKSFQSFDIKTWRLKCFQQSKLVIIYHWSFIGDSSGYIYSWPAKVYEKELDPKPDIPVMFLGNIHQRFGFFSKLTSIISIHEANECV